MASPAASSNMADSQPPCSNLPVGSSVGPPGACITPSSDTNAAPTILRIDGLPAARGLDFRDVNLLHRHHRVEHALGHRRVGVAIALKQNSRRDLPRKAPAILAPAA